MAARGAFLAPALVPAASSFVCLPRAFVQTFLGGPDALAGGAVILELSWETVDGYVQRVCAGWVGGLVKDPMRSDVIEIPAELARCMGIKDHLERMPHAFIAVHIVDSLPIARQVNVEPCTPDDWELIQLHAGSIEVELLRQMCVVNDNQVSPIWINHNTVIRVRAALPLGMEHARLTHLSEVIVAPKERQAQNADKHLSSDLFYEASPELFVQGNNQSTCQNDTIDEVWVHPQMLAMLDGAILPGAPLEIETTPVVVIWSTSSQSSVDSNLTADSDVPSSATSGKPKCVARLKCSEAVGRDKIVLNGAMSLRLELKRGSTVQLRVLRLPELPVARITLRAHCSRGDSTELEEIRKRFLELTSRSHHAIAFNSGTILPIGAVDSSNQVTHVSVDIEYTPGSSIDEALLEDVPTGALEKYTLLGAGSTLVLTPEQIRVEQASGAILQTLSTLRANQEQVADIYEESMLQVARSAKAYKELKKSVRTLLYSNAAACRVVLGTKPTGCAFLYGDRGSGKSTLLRSLSQELEGSRACGAHSVITDCRNLRGIKMESVKARLTELFDEAFAHAPSVIVLDNLDALVPEEEETAGPANDQSRRIAELLVVLMSRANDKMWKTTLELNLSYKREWEILGDTQLEARAELLKSIGAAMQRRSVAVIAAARSDSSIHKSLRNCGLFDHPIQVLSPDAERRETLIREMLSMKATGINNGLKPSASIRETVVIDPAVDFSYLASLTEGYSIRDLSSATDRTLHQTLKRYTLFESSRESLDEPRKIQQVDFVEALKDFQPTALIGVDLFKSSVKWSDVGGLGTVRTMLKDTLELPTRYGKLYENTPIKLPAGMLLYGPPGCGKTLLASAVANECGLNFISVKGPEVLNKYIGASEQAIRDLFARAASAAPSVLFLDEFDSIAPRRGADNTGVTDRLVNQLLTFLDGVEGRKGVYVLAATSRPDMIDPALLRPGRLDKSLYCGFPNEEERLDILRAVGKDMQLSEDARGYLPTIAAHPKSRHFSGADLQAVMYSAQLELVHEKLKNADSNEITKHHLEVAFESAKPSTSESARMQFDRMYAAFAKARNTDFAVADADASATSDDLKAHIAHQRTALA